MSQQEEASENKDIVMMTPHAPSKLNLVIRSPNFFSAFKDCYAMTQEMEVSPFLKTITRIGFNNVFVSIL